jgi:hypothetical protein
MPMPAAPAAHAKPVPWVPGIRRRESGTRRVSGARAVEVVREASRAPMPRKSCRVNGLRGFGRLPKVCLAVDK